MTDASLTKTERDFDILPFRGLPPHVAISERIVFRSAWLETGLAEIESFAELRQDWDSYGADPARRPLLAGAKSLIECIASSGVRLKPYIYPTRSGRVQFEWENGTRYFEIEIVGEFAATYHYSDSAERIMTSGEIFEGERLDELLDFIHRVEKAVG